jgi:hypothetical protein
MMIDDGFSALVGSKQVESEELCYQGEKYKRNVVMDT